MSRRARLVLAIVLPAALLGVWSVFLHFAGASAGVPAASAAASPAHPSPSGPLRHGAAAQRGTVAGSEALPAEAVQQQAAVEHTARAPGTPPALPALTVRFRTAPLHGRETAGPRQERAPPRTPHDPRHTRGPPSTRQS